MRPVSLIACRQCRTGADRKSGELLRRKPEDTHELTRVSDVTLGKPIAWLMARRIFAITAVPS